MTRKEYAKLHYLNNKEKYLLSFKERYNKKKEIILQKTEKQKLQNKEWRIKNKEILKQKRRLRKLSEITRLKSNLRSRLNRALKSKKATKTTNLNTLIGCTISFLKEYLSTKFKPGMSWENYGKNGWEIDHIAPCASFNLLLESEQLKCFNYTNLQPLWAVENLKKSNKIIINN